MKFIILIFTAILLQTCAANESKTLKLDDYGAPHEGICEIHNIKLQKDVVPLIFGDIAFEPEYLQSLKTKFPHANDNFHNAHNAKNYEFAEVLFCPECRRAKQKWAEDRKSPAP